MAKNAPWETLEEASLWRRVAVGMWSRPRDPAFMGMFDVEVSAMLDYLEEVEQVIGRRVTPTAFLVKAVATFFEQNPDLNVVIVGNEVRRRKDIDIFCQVAIPSEEGNQADLSGVKLENCDRIAFPEVIDRLQGRIERVRGGDDDQIGAARSSIDLIPPPLRPLAVRLVEFLTFEFPVNLERFGVPADPFGSAMVSSIAQFDAEQAFAPLVPASRCPLVIVPGKIRPKPIIEEGEVTSGQVMTISCTADHRCYDGYQGGKFVKVMKAMIRNPRAHFPDPQVWVSSSQDGARVEAQDSRRKAR